MVARRVGTQHKAVTLFSARKVWRSEPTRLRPVWFGTRGRTGDHRHPDLLDREVEGNCQALIDPVVGAIAVDLGRDPDEVADAPMLDWHALGAAGSCPKCK